MNNQERVTPLDRVVDPWNYEFTRGEQLYMTSRNAGQGVVASMSECICRTMTTKRHYNLLRLHLSPGEQLLPQRLSVCNGSGMLVGRD